MTKMGLLRRVVIGAVAAAMGLAAAGVAGAEAPPAPGFISGFPMLAGNMVMVMWMPVPGAKEYKVYRNDQLLATTPANQHMDPSDKLVGEIRYQVSAVGLDGTEGPKGSPGLVKIFKIEPPKDVAVMEVSGEARVRWESVPGATVYNLYKADKAEGPFNLLTSLTVTNYQDPALKAGEPAWYRITAKDMTGKESEPSPVIKFERKKEEAKVAAKEIMYKRTETLLRVFEGLRDAADRRVSLRAPMELGVDPGANLLYVATGGGNNVVLLKYQPAKPGYSFTVEGYYGPQGFNKEEEPAGRWNQLRAMTLDRDGKLLAVIDAIAVAVTVLDTAKGNVVATFKVTPDKERDKKEVRPVCLRFDDRGDLWVADALNDNFKVFDLSGKLLETKSGPDAVHGVGFFVLDPVGKRVYASNSGDRSVSILDWDGKLLKKFGEVGSGPGKFWAPTGIDILPDGTIVEADGIISVVNFFSPEGEMLYHLRNIDDDIFQTASTRGLAVRKDLIFVTLATNDEVRILRIEDQLRKESEAKKKAE